MSLHCFSAPHLQKETKSYQEKELSVLEGGGGEAVSDFIWGRLLAGAERTGAAKRQENAYT